MNGEWAAYLIFVVVVRVLEMVIPFLVIAVGRVFVVIIQRFRKGSPVFFSRRQKLKLLAFAPNHLIYTYIPPWESLIESSMRSIHLFAELTKKRAGFLDEVY